MAPNAPRPPGQCVLRLRIQLRGIDPVVWRRLLVPGSVRMAKLATMLIAVMGWNNSHLHAFQVGNKRYVMRTDDPYGPDPYEGPEASDAERAEAKELDERAVTALRALRDERRFVFEYDFGDGWEHDVVIESLTWSHFGLKYAVCLDGEHACPPDDVGGVPGYRQFCEALADPGHDEHEECLEWIGGFYDPTEFDIAGANALCQRVR